MKEYKKIKNDYYEFVYDEKYQKDIEKILEYSTKKLLENLKYFGEESMVILLRFRFLIIEKTFLIEFMK